MPLPVESHMSAVRQKIVHTPFGTNGVKRIGKGTLSITAVRKHSDDRSKDI